MYADVITFHIGHNGWRTYARALPDTYTTPFSWTKTDLAKHSGFDEQVTALEPHLRGQYDAMFPLLSASPDAETASMFPSAVFTYEAWLWAHMTYTSRCFPRILSGASTSDNADDSDNDSGSTSTNAQVDEDDGVLMPLIDMLNHDHGTCNTVLCPAADGRGGGRELHLAQAVKKGDPVLYSYGAKSNDRLVLSYGFAQWVWTRNCFLFFPSLVNSRRCCAPPYNRRDKAAPSVSSRGRTHLSTFCCRVQCMPTSSRSIRTTCLRRSRWIRSGSRQQWR